MARRTTAAAVALAAAALAAAGCGGSAADKAAKGNTIVTLRVIKFKGQVLALVPVQINGHAFTFALDTERDEPTIRTPASSRRQDTTPKTRSPHDSLRRTRPTFGMRRCLSSSVTS